MIRQRRNPHARRKNPRPEEFRRGVRLERCDRCWRECRRAETVICPLTYSETKTELGWAVEAGTRRWVTPHTVLGRMWEMKEDEWRRYTDLCEHQGERLPTTIEDLFEWAKKLSAVDVRIAIGVSPNKAKGMKTALKVSELAAYYEHMRTKLPPDSDWYRPDDDEFPF